MPAPASSRIASSSSSSGHRTTTTSRLAPSTASNRMDHAGQDDEEWDAEDAARDSKIPRKTAVTKKPAVSSKSSTKKASSAAHDLESDGDQASSSPSARIAALESKVSRLRDERDTYLAQFTELKALRSTAVESDLASYKKAAEARFRHSEDLVKSYKTSLDRAEKRLRGEMGVMGDEEKEREEENERLRREVDTLKREKKKADEEARRLALELRTEVESSRALLSNSKTSGNGTSASSGSGFNRDGDNQAVRRLYEDLTGIVISRIELCEREAGDDVTSERRRYTGVYAAVGHHDLQLSIEESTSTLPPSSSSSSSSSSSKTHGQLRKDLVFRPHLDSQRDAELLCASSNLPEYLREEIRFDRGLSVKFLGTLEKGLKR